MYTFVQSLHFILYTQFLFLSTGRRSFKCTNTERKFFLLWKATLMLALVSTPSSGWRKQRGGQPLTWRRSMKEITKRLGVVGATHLQGWGPRGPHCAWLETLQDMAANGCQWRSCCQFLSRLPELSSKSLLYGSEATVLNTDNIKLTETQGLCLPDEPQEGRNRSYAVEEFSATSRVVAACYVLKYGSATLYRSLGFLLRPLCYIKRHGSSTQPFMETKENHYNCIYI
ncbi:hypothetical protein T265_03416 [Opisthorchis viverrini]|uniref:Uncharacterized protein n=1 Tax=Opisthorchis viverrini TaxID=6198 RepID=A0A074ZRI6_OPIVI|nr:hypothetical protein T265_03416 [Opisthorchis viverrini]KER30038.1 hypothetical protein T265_03416 [Opisthorchis viverrini]